LGLLWGLTFFRTPNVDATKGFPWGNLKAFLKTKALLAWEG